MRSAFPWSPLLSSLGRQLYGPTRALELIGPGLSHGARRGWSPGYHRPRGALAQLGERLLCKQEVAGSIPAGSTEAYTPARSTEGSAMKAAGFLGVALCAIVFAGTANAAPPTWSNVKVQRISPGVPWTEPRITVGPDGTTWAVTNGEKPSDSPGAGGEENTAPAIVMYSTDGGNTWHKTPADFAGQTQATPDVDIITLPTGRVIASELDSAGINFPGAVTDDRGKTWQQSTGTNTLADQDRQWLAAGPNPKTGKAAGALPFHPRGSGNASHGMFVAASDDG